MKDIIMSNYWVDRFTAEENRINELSKEQVKEAKKQYDIALKNTNQKIYEFYAKYAKDNNISMYEAKQRFNKKELKEFKMSLSEYIRKGQSLNIDPDDAIIKELKNVSSRVHIERLEALKMEIKAEIDLLSKTMENNLDKHLRSVYRDTYYRSAYSIQKGLDKFSNIEKLNPELLESLVYKPWTKDNTNWSKRIWGNDGKLVNTLHTNLTQNIITGKPLKDIIDTIEERFNVERNIATRLIMTESAAYHSRAKERCMKDLGCEKYEVIATLDDRTSSICRSMDSKVFDMKDYQVGVTAPPFHSNCYDKETEVYTNSGWKLFKDLNENELVFTINPDNLESEWQKPINYISYKYHGNMISFKNSRFDLLVTPNHNILVQNSDYSVKDKTWKLKEASKVGRKSKHRMFAGLNWTGANKEYEILAEEKVDIETYLKFMAYWLSDGSCTLDKNSYSIKIAQYNNDWMYEELKKFPFKIYKCKESLMIHNKELGKELSKFGKCTTKFIPDNIKELSPELIRIFLLAYSKADGTVRKGKVWKGYKFNDSIQFFTSSDKLASDLGELILKAGGRPSYYLNKCAGKEIEFKNGVYTINKDVWIINWNTQLHNYLYNMEIKDVEYNDYVYCVEVPKYHTLLVRRNGKICWSGNCRTVTAPYYDKIEGDTNLRASRTEDNDYELVDVKDYQDWYDNYVEKKIIERSTANELERKLPRLTRQKEGFTRHQEEITCYKATGTKNKIYMEEKTRDTLIIDDFNNKTSVKESIKYIDDTLSKAFETMGMDKNDFGDLKVIVMTKENAFASYYPKGNIIYINPVYLGSEKVYNEIFNKGILRNLTNADNILSTYVHELTHAYENMYYKKFHKEKDVLKIKEENLKKVLEFIKENGYNIEEKISLYAYEENKQISEILAEAYTRKKLGKTNLLIEYILDMYGLGDD